jgi:hypothetical protein
MTVPCVDLPAGSTVLAAPAAGLEPNPVGPVRAARVSTSFSARFAVGHETGQPGEVGMILGLNAVGLPPAAWISTGLVAAAQAVVPGAVLSGPACLVGRRTDGTVGRPADLPSAVVDPRVRLR